MDDRQLVEAARRGTSFEELQRIVDSLCTQSGEILGLRICSTAEAGFSVEE